MNNQQVYYKQKLEFEIDSWDLSESISQDKNIIVIDTRSPEAYQKEHIPSSINIPHRTMSPESTSQLNKEALYVCYCDGIGCNGSTKGAFNMLNLGFKIKELIGGLDWWKRDGHKTEGNSSSFESKKSCGC